MDLPQVGSPSHVPNINDPSNSVGDNDYTQLAGVQVTFHPDNISQTVTLFTTSDGIAEGNEDLIAFLTVTDTRVTIFNRVANVTIIEEGRKDHQC